MKVPKRPCSYPGCPVLVEHGYCDRHKKGRRGTSASRGYGYRWRKYTKRYLAENPLCVECEKEGIVAEATDVDHKVAVKGPDDPLFWEPKNHQGLCHPHHSMKTARENGGFGR